MRSVISALAGLALAGSFAFAQPSDGRLKIIHETATLRVAYRIDSRPFSYVDDQGRPVGYTIELCERIARSLEAQLNVGITIKWVPVDDRTRFDAIVNDTADMECGSTTVSLSRMWKPIAVPKLTAGVALRPPLYYMVGVEQGASSAVALAPAEIRSRRMCLTIR